MEVAGTAIDCLLLGRILMLRLHRIYLFITLICVMDVFFDGVGLWLGESSQGGAVFLYSRFLYAFLFPLAAWDVFEEVKTGVSKLRRLAAARLVSGLFFAAVFGLIASAFYGNNDADAGPGIAGTLGLLLWVGSSTAALAFLWTLQRQIRAQQIARPRNTGVLMMFYELYFAGQILSCLCLIVVQLLPKSLDLMGIVLQSYQILIVTWCILKLRAAASDVPSEPANASL